MRRELDLRMRLGDLALTVGAITLAVASLACETGSEAGIEGAAGEAAREVPAPQFTLTADQTHNRFSRTIEPILRVQSGAVIEAFTEEASDQQLTPESTVELGSKVEVGCSVLNVECSGACYLGTLSPLLIANRRRHARGWRRFRVSCPAAKPRNTDRRALP